MKKLSIFTLILLFCYVTVYSQSCLPDGIEFTTQSQIDSFQILHPNCTEIEGDVLINGKDITNLNGLTVLTSFGGGLDIFGNESLISLAGLENATSIVGYLSIWANDTLASLTGLENLTFIGDGLYLGVLGQIGCLGNHSLISLFALSGLSFIEGDIFIGGNDALTSLTGLEGLTSIDGYISICDNASLASLIGLGNIASSTIESLSIGNNHYLSTCEVQSICDYLANPGGSVEIYDNAIGCNSPEEVQDSCIANGVNIDEQSIPDNVKLYPNPANQELNISTEGFALDQVAIYTLTGQQVLQERPVYGTIDISHLPPGMYIVEVSVENRSFRQKLLVE